MVLPPLKFHQVLSSPVRIRVFHSAFILNPASDKNLYSKTPASVINAITETMIRAIFNAFLTSNRRRQTDRRTRAELRRMCRISRFPAAFVALVLRTPAGFGLPHSAQNLPLFTAPQLHVQPSACTSGFFVPHSGQNFPVAVAPHCGHFQLPAAGFGSGFLLPQFGQKLPVIPLCPQLHVQPFAGAAGAAGAGCCACCCAPI